MNLQNLIDYGQYFDIDVLSGVNVPAPLSNETMKSAIMIRCGLLTPVHGEPELFRDMVAHWFTVKQWTIEHLIKIIQAEYSPIENYDRYEDSTDEKNESATLSKSGKYTDTHSGTDKETNNGTYKNTHSGTDTDTKENTVSAYNSSSYQPDSKTVDSYKHGHVESNAHDDAKNFTHGHKIANTHEDAETEKREGGATHTSHMHGNIGVTTNQQMIEQELELLRHFDIYGYIAERFEEDNMLMIY